MVVTLICLSAIDASVRLPQRTAPFGSVGLAQFLWNMISEKTRYTLFNFFPSARLTKINAAGKHCSIDSRGRSQNTPKLQHPKLRKWSPPSHTEDLLSMRSTATAASAALPKASKPRALTYEQPQITIKMPSSATKKTFPWWNIIAPT